MVVTVQDNELALLVNPALAMLGASALDALSTSTDNLQNLASITFLQLVEEVLMEANWSGVQKRDGDLTVDSDHTQDEFYYGYDLPSDFVHLVGEPRYLQAGLSPLGQRHWRVTGTKLETTFQGPDILYVYKSEELVDANSAADTYFTLMRSPLKMAIIAKLQAAWADAVAGKDPIKYEQLYQIRLNKARATNNKQTPPPRITPDTLVVSRQLSG